MTRSTLRYLLRSLANAAPARTPALTILVGLRDGSLEQPALYERYKRSTLDGASRLTRPGLELGFESAERFLQRDVRRESRGAAIIVRTGEKPLRHHLQFGAALPTEVTATAWPSLFRLIDLEQTLGSFVLMRRAGDSFEVCEGSLGDVDTRQPWRPDAGRAGDEEVAQRTLRIAWNVARHTARAGGHDRVILAAEPGVVEQVRAIDARLDYSEPWAVLDDLEPADFDSQFRRAVALNRRLRLREDERGFADLMRNQRDRVVADSASRAASYVRHGDAGELWLRKAPPDSAVRPAAWQEDLVRFAARRATLIRFAPAGSREDAQLRSLGGAVCVQAAAPRIAVAA